MQIKESKFVFFYFHLFFGIGTFQRAMPKKNKNFSRPSTRALGCGLDGFSNSRELSPPGCGPACRFR
jgi:hypothetical protein